MTTSRRIRRRTGALQTMELLVVLPIVILIVSAAFEFGLMFLAQQRLQMATNVASRSLTSTNHQGLSGEQLAQVAFATAIGDVPWAKASQIQIEIASQEAGLVRVTGSVPAASVAPDLLAAFGLGLADRTLVASIVTTGS